MAEHTNLIKPLTQRVLELALAQLAEWDELGVEVSAAVNISTAVLIDEHFTPSVTAALATAGVAPRRLKLEVTESTLMSDPEITRAILQELATMGIEIAIDDFGTGYSSLSYLQRFPIDVLKIDKSFVDGMTSGAEPAALVRTIVALSESLQLRTVAEGIEQADQAEHLRSLGCDRGQGYLWAKPLTAAGLGELLNDQRRDRRLAAA